MTKYAQAYPNLKQELSWLDNFEVVMSAVEKYFPDLFKLNSIEFALGEEDTKNISYVVNSIQLLEALNGRLKKRLYTEGEVVRELLTKLKSRCGEEDYFKTISFVPRSGEQDASQIGILEKIFSGQLSRVGEPLSYLDMKRILLGANHLITSYKLYIEVFHLAQIIEDEDSQAFIQELKYGGRIFANKGLIINVNQHLDQHPKWVVVKIPKEQSDLAEVYCEMPLTEAEKSSLESKLQLLGGVKYLGATGDSVASTGYSAIAWINNNIRWFWNFDLTADFPALMGAILYVMQGGDSKSRPLSYQLQSYEQEKFFTEDVKFIKDIFGGEKGKIIPGSFLPYLITISSAGQIRESSYSPGDVQSAIRIVAKNLDPSKYSIINEKFLATITMVPGFDKTLLRMEIITQDEGGSVLKVPDNIDTEQLHLEHDSSCWDLKINSTLLDQLQKENYNQYLENPITNYAAMMVFSFIRSKSKKRNLSIELPECYQLNQKHLDMVINLLRQNVYVTNLDVDVNQGLTQVREALTPIFARNRWLADCGYRPPLIDNYWHKAAKHWVVQLNERPDFLEIKQEHMLFKKCVHDMGIEGLTHILDYLSDESEQDFFDMIYGQNRPAFYAACPAANYEEYLGLIINHLHRGYYFPYSKFGVSYHPGQDSVLLVLINEINQLEQFKQVTLTDFLVDGLRDELRPAEDCLALLNIFIEEATQNQWTALIAIPELENEEHLTEQYRELRRIYTYLNDVIIENRHQLAADTTLNALEDASSFVVPDVGVSVEIPQVVSAVTEPSESIDIDIDAALERLDANGHGPWALETGSSVGLQVQQQQEIQTSQQIQIAQEKVVVKTIEEAFTETLVDYSNIDDLLDSFFKQYKEENEIINSAARLKINGESQLQGFFHTWVSANPEVNAPHVIHKMTQAAAKSLLKSHGRLTSGLNPDNLPKGFYTQKTKNNELVLCYDPESPYVKLPNPLTLKLTTERPEAVAWKGDFRQFDLKSYDGQTDLGDKGLGHILLFAMMQPQKDNYSEEFERFLNNKYPETGELIKESHQRKLLNENRDKICKHWDAFMQLWQFGGDEGIQLFINAPPENLNLPIDKAVDLLMQDADKSHIEWVKSNFDTEKQIRGLGQVYYQYGRHGITLLLAKFRQIELALGSDFFNEFKQSILGSIDNYNCFMSSPATISIDRMMECLRPVAKSGFKNAFQDIMSLHIASLGWEQFDRLWRAFDYFQSELAQLDLELEGNEFSNLDPENMVVCLDRILASLKKIPSQDMQQQFLHSLQEMDLNQGGVHYAIQYERFKFFDNSLELSNFKHGSPTYSPDILSLYDWQEEDTRLNMLRALASEPKFSYQAYQVLAENISDGSVESRSKLMWLVHSRYIQENIQDKVDSLKKLSPDYLGLIAHTLHHTVYVEGNRELDVDFDALIKLQEVNLANTHNLCKKFTKGTFLESVTIIERAGWDEESKRHCINIMAEMPKPQQLSAYFFNEGFKLAALFNAWDEAILKEYHTMVESLSPIVSQQLRLMITQILSVDYDASDLNRLDQDLFTTVLEEINAMKEAPVNSSEIRIGLIECLNEKGIVFKYSKSGDYRTLRDIDEDKPESLDFFIDHKDRLWRFLQAHIAVSASKDVQESLAPIMRLFKQLQLNRTYLNEVEPLLASLEQIAAGKYWSAEYFQGLLKALQPTDGSTSFPISLLKVLIGKYIITAKEIDKIDVEFPQPLTDAIQIILQNQAFDREQKTRLCELALKEYEWSGVVALTNDIINTLSTSAYKNSRIYALDILTSATHLDDLRTRFDNCQWFTNHPGFEDVSPTWQKSNSIWLKALSANKIVNELLVQLQTSLNDNPDKQALVTHIMAFSTLQPGLRDSEDYSHELSYLSERLMNKLTELSMDDLIYLSRCYPGEPCPGTYDLLYMIRHYQQENTNTPQWSEVVESFLRSPHSEVRADYGDLSATREADLQRMIAESAISGKDAREPITVEMSARLTMVFSYLKELESGAVRLDGFAIPINKMSREELSLAFFDLSRKSQEKPDEDKIRTQIWAVLFECLGRTTRKYPHLAQQFALIANDICIDSTTSVLQLATGEGKSHFIAMRAARHVGLGKTVDVCTAKRTLAYRDREDYLDFFNYLDIPTSYIHSKSSHDTYMNTKVHFTTIGDLSLFQDEQSFNGTPIEIDKALRVALFDEFDNALEEGRKTDYNYARPTGKTPKQMNWFYQSSNAFYSQIKEDLLEKKQITADHVRLFAMHLKEDAGDIEDRQAFVARLISDLMQLVQWIRSDHIACQSEWGVNFTVREKLIEVGDEAYPMREIIPFSSGNQIMEGSTFSAGVQQLLAVLLNTKARLDDDSQNFHVHPESHIISSQIAAHLMTILWGHWEGFSGTISSAQASNLNRNHGTKVLHVPTNQRDLRHWHKPEFCDSNEERMDKVVEAIRDCIAHNKSMLFSCKNDKYVELLRTQLEKKLTSEELEHFMFYTNEDKRPAEKILKDKQDKEQWRGGQKHKAIALAASGFGRGDNVGVEAVFLFDVNDNNDKLQKGGRTARNGAEGEVFQFYIQEDIEKEYNALLDILSDMGNEYIEEVNKRLPLEENATVEDIFEYVMLIREYLFSLNNAATEGYRFVVAELSWWAIHLLGQVENPTIRDELTNRFSNMLKTINKEWLTVSSNEKLDANKKIAEIRDSTNQHAAKFTKYYNEVTQTEKQPPQLTKRDSTHIQVGQLNRQKLSDGKTHAVQHICSAIARAKGLSSHPSAMIDIPRKLQEICDLESGTRNIKTLAQKMQMIHTKEQFEEVLETAYIDAIMPYQKHEEIVPIEEHEIFDEKLYQGIDVDMVSDMKAALNDLTPELQSKTILFFYQENLLELEPQSLMNKILPLVKFLGKFSRDDQQSLGAEYIDAASELLFVRDPTISYILFEVLLPMQLHFFKAILELGQQQFSGREDLLRMIATVIQQGLHGNPEQRLRMLTRWEGWAKSPSSEQRASFLHDFCNTMSSFEEGKNWDIFVRLMAKTHRWWNRGNERNEFQPELLKFWHNLSVRTADIPYIGSYLMKGLRHGGESWFHFLNIALNSLSRNVLVLHDELLYQLGHFIIEQKLEIEAQIPLFENYCQGLVNFETNLDREGVPASKLIEELNNLPIGHSQVVLDYFARHNDLIESREPAFVSYLFEFEEKRFIKLLKFTTNNKEVFSANPELYDRITEYTHNTSISLERLDCVLNFWENNKDKIIENPKLHDIIFAFLLDEQNAQESIDSITTLWTNNYDSINQLPELGTHLIALNSNYHNEMLTKEELNKYIELSLRAVNYKINHPKANFELLLDSIGSQQAQTHDEIARLNYILEIFDPAISAQPLVDNSFNFLQYYAKQENYPLDLAKQIIKDFYKAKADLASVEEANLVDMLDNELFKDDFNFRANEAEIHHQRRVLFMHLLKYNAFVTPPEIGSSTGDNQQSYALTNEESNQILDLCFNKYVEHTKTVLEAPNEGLAPGVRDLSVSQQIKLLQVARDFEVIGSVDYMEVTGKREIEKQVQELRTELLEKLSRYESKWFKSSQRKNISADLRQNIGASTSYENILVQIHNARKTAMQSDREINDKRRVFMVNRGGSSRFFDTLNQMEDMVLKTWAKDEKSALAMPNYREFARNEFKDVVKEFKANVLYYRDKTFNPDMNSIFSAFRRTFSKSDYKGLMTTLSDKLELLAGIDTTDQKYIETMEGIKSMLVDQGLNSRLPGHLQTLAKEFLIRVDGMRENIKLDKEDITKGLGRN